MKTSLHYSYLGYVHGYLGYIHGYLGCENLMEIWDLILGSWYPGSWCVVLKFYLNV